MSRAEENRSELFTTEVIDQFPTDERPVRDPTYYLEDGSCVFLVENVLFKLHKSMLSRDSLIFGSMLSLPQPEERDGVDVEGLSDANPIVCHDDVEEFRALCWVIYARPDEIAAQSKLETAQIPKLIRVASIANKYEFTAMREWALDLLGIHSKQAMFVQKCPGSVFQLFEVAHICGNPSLAELCFQRLTKELIPKAPPSEKWDWLKRILDVTERYNMLYHQARAYYACLVGLGKFTGPWFHGAYRLSALATFTDDFTDLSALNETRQLRLLRGYWSLMLLLAQFKYPPPLDDNPACPNHPDCKDAWLIWWGAMLTERAGSVFISDPEGFVCELPKTLERHPVVSYQSRELVFCHTVIEDTIQSMPIDFEENLPRHFMLCP